MHRRLLWLAGAVLALGLLTYLPGRLLATEACGCGANCEGGSCSCSGTGSCRCACSALGNPACLCADE